MAPLLCACAVVITLETQKCRKRAPRSVEFNFLLIAIDRNGFRRIKEEKQIYKRLQNWVNDLQFLTRILTSFKGFYWPKARRKDVQKSSDISVYNTINREEVRRSRRWYIIHCILYNVPTTTSPNLFPVVGVVHRNIGTFLYIFSSRFWSVKSIKTTKGCLRFLVFAKGQSYDLTKFSDDFTPFFRLWKTITKSPGKN